ncbi:chemoreceptor glutamine deamidase CheD [Methylophaga sp.]|uniref:chemoreceptor glutamine deamidase CheD n=1 Tax=Methylophaga sp. TaxID=2024840 RepID=UPI001400D59B|nr:chemoreceptor glutamine deamidase CheD [Methylophaga sp.]MTI63782.1 chemoreceptor glutamine deamidase CheD [Methylophaga sp.]
MMLARSIQPTPLKGFEHINRYWDGHNHCWAAKLLPGEFYVTTEPDEIICTTLGSCVSACIRDPQAGVAGMNHFMLPVSSEDNPNWMNMATRFGSAAMEYLINEMFKQGASRETMEVKLVGGGRIISSLYDVGRRNIDFVLEYARLERLRVLAKDLGDVHPRKVVFHPDSGVMRVKRLRSLHNDTVIQREQHYVAELQTQPVTGDIELF